MNTPLLPRYPLPVPPPEGNPLAIVCSTLYNICMTKSGYLGEFEQVVLLAVARLGEAGYGTTIRREIERRTGRQVTVGAVYATLARLEEKGYVGSWVGRATSKRGGRSKRHYRVEPAGEEALAVTRKMLERMWDGVDLGADPGRA